MLLRILRVVFLWKIEDPEKYTFLVVTFKVENHNKQYLDLLIWIESKEYEAV